MPTSPASTPTTPPVKTGSSGIVSVHGSDPRFVLKGYQTWKDGRCTHSFEPAEDSIASLEVEDEVYRRLGSHPAILEYGGREEVASNVYSLKLERAEGDLRSLMSECPAPSEQVRLGIGIQIASGMAHIHSKGVFHCDLSCRNIFLLDGWVVKIGDFGGSKIDGRDAVGAEEIRYELPLRGRTWGQRGYVQREIFALGCAVYEVMAWEKPFAELSNSEVEERYGREEFPDVEGLPAGDIIRRCWKEDFQRVEDVEEALRKELTELEISQRSPHVTSGQGRLVIPPMTTDPSPVKPPSTLQTSSRLVFEGADRVRKWGHAPLLRREAEAMNYVHANALIPIPKILDTHFEDDTDDGKSWILMQKLPGLQLGAAWPDMDAGAREETTRQLRSHLQQLHRLHPPHPGWIGSVSGGPAFDHRLSNMSTCGPFSSVSGFHDFLAAPVQLSPRPEWADKYRSQLADTCGVRFSHADLSWENILVDPSTGNINGILDWEMAGFWPEWWEFRKALFGSRSQPWWIQLMREVTTDYSKETDVDMDLEMF